MQYSSEGDGIYIRRTVRVVGKVESKTTEVRIIY